MATKDIYQWLAHVKTAASLLDLIIPFATLLYLLTRTLYNLLFHPLRSYPGPLIWRATRLPYDWHTYHGTLHERIVTIHRHYGPIVRLSPNELSFTSS